MDGLSANRYLISVINALVMCAALPLTGFVVHIIADYVLGNLINLITGNKNAYYRFFNYITAPGVVWHELSHALAALITLAKIDKVELYHRTEEGLGGVYFHTRGGIIMQSIQTAVISCAPVVTGILAIFGAFSLYNMGTIPLLAWIPIGYLLICIVLHMTMSKQDILIYIRGIWLFFIVFFAYSLYVTSNIHGVHP